MIENLSEILESFIEKEDSIYEEFEYDHNPTLGALYESLTGEIVNRVIPKQLNLNVRGGFIYDDNGFKSGEIDKMLVQGDGKRLGLTDKYQYHIKDVLVVFEVKKTLTKSDFIDAYNHVGAVSKAYRQYIQSDLDSDKIDIQIAAKLFAQITGHNEPVKYSEIHNMQKEMAVIFYTLVMSTLVPLTIIHGYAGYKTEAGLRRVFLDYLVENIEEPNGFGVISFPNLVTSEKYSLVKTTGMPHFQALNADEYWPVLGSSRKNVVQEIIELVWTKISYKFDLMMPWGDDMQSEVLAGLLFGKVHYDKKKDESGWMYNSVEFKESELKKLIRTTEWEPEILNDKLKEVADWIFLFGEIDTDDGQVLDLCDNNEAEKQALIEGLVQTRIFSHDNNIMKIIGEAAYLQELEDDSVAISNDENRLINWCKKMGIPMQFRSYKNVGNEFSILSF